MVTNRRQLLTIKTFTPENQGLCSVCGHINERSWVMCDSCGARLPWAPPPKEAPKVSEMTDEQLRAFYGELPKREPFFLFTNEGRKALMILVLLISLAASLLQVLFSK
jgi:hypothetical protein